MATRCFWPADGCVQLEASGEVADVFLQRLVPLAGAAFDEAEGAAR